MQPRVGIMSPLALRTVAMLAALAATGAYAQCTKDTDCKGDRVCSAGECVAPEIRSPEWATQPSAQALYAERSHWARPAAVIGIVSGAAVLGFGTAAAVLSGDTVPAITAGSAALISAAVGAPIVAAGASSARWNDSITGSLPTRIVGWSGYGLAMTTGAVMVVLGFVVTFEPALILTVTGLGVTSIAALTVDAFISASQADAWRAPAARGGSSSTVVPTMTLIRGRDGSVVPLAGVAGSL